MSPEITLTAGDLVNLIQRQAVELARLLDTPRQDVGTQHILSHIERMHAFALRLHENITALETHAAE